MVSKLLKLNGLAILGTVVNHMHGWGLIAMFLWTHRYQQVTVPNFDQVGSYAYYFLRIIEQLIAFSIPAFLLVSGFFISFSTQRNKNTVSWHYVFIRIKLIVIPYLVWCAIIIIGHILEGKSYNLLFLIRIIITGEIAGPYYFIPLLIQLYLISPFLVPLARSRWKLLLVITAILQLFAQILLYLHILNIEFWFSQNLFYIPGWFFPSRIFWFALGITFGFNLTKFRTWLLKIKWAFLLGTILFFILGFIEWEFITSRINNWVVPIETIIDSLYAISFLFFFLSFDDLRFPFENWIKDLGSKSFGIYLVHVPAQAYAARIIYHLTPWILGQQLLFLPLVFLAGLGIPLGLMKVVSKTPVNRYYKYIFG